MSGPHIATMGLTDELEEFTIEFICNVEGNMQILITFETGSDLLRIRIFKQCLSGSRPSLFADIGKTLAIYNGTITENWQNLEFLTNRYLPIAISVMEGNQQIYFERFDSEIEHELIKPEDKLMTADDPYIMSLEYVCPH